jgi:hypothetical protein
MRPIIESLQHSCVHARLCSHKLGKSNDIELSVARRFVPVIAFPSLTFYARSPSEWGQTTQRPTTSSFVHEVTSPRIRFVYCPMAFSHNCMQGRSALIRTYKGTVPPASTMRVEAWGQSGRTRSSRRDIINRIQSVLLSA